MKGQIAQLSSQVNIARGLQELDGLHKSEGGEGVRRLVERITLVHRISDRGDGEVRLRGDGGDVVADDVLECLLLPEGRMSKLILIERACGEDGDATEQWLQAGEEVVAAVVDPSLLGVGHDDHKADLNGLSQNHVHGLLHELVVAHQLGGAPDVLEDALREPGAGDEGVIPVEDDEVVVEGLSGGGGPLVVAGGARCDAAASSKGGRVRGGFG